MIANDREPSKPTQIFSKINCCKAKLSVALIGLTVLCWLGYYIVFEKPHYTILSIPSPLVYTSNRSDWSTTEYSELYWSEKPNAHYYIWRRVTQAHDTTYNPDHGFASWEALIKYFDDWLVDQGWVLYEDNSFNPCRSYLPESSFLPRGENGYVVYRQENTLRFAAEPTVCIAVWPVEPAREPVGTYNVVLITVTPSLFTEWDSQFNLVP